MNHSPNSNAPFQLPENTTLIYKAQSKILLKGFDAKSFLHRVSTNSVQNQPPGSNSINLVLTPKGRLVDLFHQIILAEDKILLLTGPGRSQALIDWLDQFLFSEEVEFLDLTEKGGLIWSNENEHLNKLSDDYVCCASFEVSLKGLEKEPSYFVFHKELSSDEIADRCFPGATEIDFNTARTIRVASDLPFYPGEIKDKFNPLEVALKKYISWDKGCYTGQEVVSRIDTYQKNAKSLYALAVNQADFKDLKEEQEVVLNDKVFGYITTVAPLYWAKKTNALAVLKTGESNSLPQTAHIKAGTKLFEAKLTKIPT